MQGLELVLMQHFIRSQKANSTALLSNFFKI